MTLGIQDRIEPNQIDQDSCLKLIIPLLASLMYNDSTEVPLTEPSNTIFYVDEPVLMTQNCTIVDVESEQLLKGVIIFLTMVILILAVVIILLLFTMKFRRDTGVVTIPYSYDEASHRGRSDNGPKSNRSVSFERQDRTPLISV